MRAAHEVHVIAVDIEQLRRTERVIAVAGGQHKVRAISGRLADRRDRRIAHRRTHGRRLASVARLVNLFAASQENLSHRTACRADAGACRGFGPPARATRWLQVFSPLRWNSFHVEQNT